ncbi:MAG: hypothetical protein LQ340_000380 [Diploschistes diacapsis]|nr:MAG: hypothetical protein LQ340_000380 [Diploschistes diacapsis]
MTAQAAEGRKSETKAIKSRLASIREALDACTRHIQKTSVAMQTQDRVQADKTTSSASVPDKIKVWEALAAGHEYCLYKVEQLQKLIPVVVGGSASPDSMMMRTHQASGDIPEGKA